MKQNKKIKNLYEEYKEKSKEENLPTISYHAFWRRVRERGQTISSIILKIKGEDNEKKPARKIWYENVYIKKRKEKNFPILRYRQVIALLRWGKTQDELINVKKFVKKYSINKVGSYKDYVEKRLIQMVATHMSFGYGEEEIRKNIGLNVNEFLIIKKIINGKRRKQHNLCLQG